MITTQQNPAWLAWAGEVLRVSIDPAQAAWITRLNADGTPSAVAIYTRVSKHNCEMSIATDGRARWASREFLRVCYRYPFEQLGVGRVTGLVEDGNDAALRMNRKLGHVEEARLDRWFGVNKGVVFRLFKEDCRWL